jgi:ParB family chromosome partitioning protein
MITEQELKRVPIASIVMNPEQPRMVFDEEELDALAQSIETVGVIHPPVVRLLEGTECYELVSGERRLRACQRLGMSDIPVVIKFGDQQFSAEAALIENIQRVDLNPIEVAKALKKLMEEYRLSQEELANRVGKKRSTVANYLRLLTLPLIIQDSVSNGNISMGHAKALLSIPGIEAQIAAHTVVLRNNMTVRETEDFALELAGGHGDADGKKDDDREVEERDVHLDALAEVFQQTLGTKVVIQGNASGGKVVINYYGLKDLERLMELMSIVEL